MFEQSPPQRNSRSDILWRVQLHPRIPALKLAASAISPDGRVASVTGPDPCRAAHTTSATGC